MLCFVDSRAALGALPLQKGKSSQGDASKVLLVVWRIATESGLAPFFQWVPSALNCADVLSPRLAARFGREVIFRVDRAPLYYALDDLA